MRTHWMGFAGSVATTVVATAAAAQVATVPRPVTSPRSLASPANPAARPVPLEPLATIPASAGAAWGSDGRTVVMAANLSTRVNLWRTDTAAAAPVQLTRSDEAQGSPTVSADGRHVYYLQDAGGNEYFDVWRVPVAGGPAEQVTRTPELRESNLLFARGGAIALATKARAEGQSNLAVMDAAGRTRALTREADPQFAWRPVAWIDGDRALIANRDRVDSRVSEVWRVDVATGRATRLLGKADTNFIAGGASPDGRLIALTTNDGTGQMHAAVHDTMAGRTRTLRPTPWEQAALALSPDGTRMLIRTNVDARTTLALVDTATLAETPLRIAPGVAGPAGSRPFSPDGRQLLLSRSGADSPGEVIAYDIAAGRGRQVTRFAPPTLAAANLPKSEVVTYLSFDRTPISAVVTMPFNLARDGRAPAIVIPHGGPTGQSLDGFNRTATALASRGYVVIQPNFRGSTGYGSAFQRANYKDLGGGDLRDTVAAKDFLVATGYVDPARVGITGGSYGGFMTLMALGRTPDAFAAGVQLFGIINWRTMYRDQDAQLQAYQRGLIGTPDADAAVYDAASPLTYIRQAKAPLLSLQGENDIRVPRGQAQEVADILKAEGRTVETVFYPAEGHGFRKRENQIDSLKRTVEWFDRYLKPADRTAAR